MPSTYTLLILSDYFLKVVALEYACYKDAETAVENWLSGHKIFRLEELSIESKSRRMNGKIGRPKKGEILETYYSVKAKVQVDEEHAQYHVARIPHPNPA